MAASDFPHLSLIEKARGDAKLPPAPQRNEDVERNKQNRSEHGHYLADRFTQFDSTARKLKSSREAEGLPTITAGTPFLLQIPEGDEVTLDFLSEKLGLELVAEYDAGFLIVSTQALDLDAALRLANDFIESERGSGQMANILSVDPDPLSQERIHRILDEDIISRWPLSDAQEYIFDVSIEIAPFNTPSASPKGLRQNSLPETRQRIETAHEEETATYWEQWEKKKSGREKEIEAFIHHYEGQIISITDESHLVEFPDSFSMRIQMNGKGFVDFIKNYPNLFEVLLPDEIQQPHGTAIGSGTEEGDFVLSSPEENSPTLCVIDSGMQENHRWLENAILNSSSRCFIPDSAPGDVADYFRDGGHGTRVAGACLYPEFVPPSGTHQALFWLLNARVLDEENNLSPLMFPADVLRTIVEFYHGLHRTRLFQHSINASGPCRLSRMSIWATAIDQLSYSQDALFFQSAGNLKHSGSVNFPGIIEHISSGREYPDYLGESSSRVANPAQSLQAITVGSISREFFENGDKRSMAPSDHPSAFTRSGFGLWNSIKPEVVEFGGDWLRDSGSPPALSLGPEISPELLRSTLHGGPAIARDAVGTSFATPKVAHIGGVLESMFPDRGTLLYRALIVNSARWPEWAERGNAQTRLQCSRTLGYGVPNIERATTNSENRVTLISDQTYDITAGEGYIFGVPIPASIRRPGSDHAVRVDVCLSYVAEPRRTRKSRRGYLGVWLDWRSSRLRESFDAFQARSLKDFEAEDDSNDGNFSWRLGAKERRDGATDGVHRGNGTVQKDWAVARSYELPEVFGVVVRGHKGWARNNTDATARFALVVSFEMAASEVNIYEEVRVAVEAESVSQVEQRAQVTV